MSIWHRNESCREFILKEESVEFIKKHIQKNENNEQIKIR
jgi:hypothetical protein